jgi:isopenicillin N synthase-like dioxygenase
LRTRRCCTYSVGRSAVAWTNRRRKVRSPSPALRAIIGFPVGGELTSGQPDVKEGLYFGDELGDDDPRVIAGWPMHGASLFPDEPRGLREVVPAYMRAQAQVGQRVLRALALALGVEATYFATTAVASRSRPPRAGSPRRRSPAPWCATSATCSTA